MQRATIRVPGIKVAVPLAADALPTDLVPMEGPAGEPTIDVVLDGSSLTVRAKVNGKNYRKMIKQIAEQGAPNVAVILQGLLRPPPPRAGRSYWRGPASRSSSRRPSRPTRAGIRRRDEPEPAGRREGSRFHWRSHKLCIYKTLYYNNPFKLVGCVTP